MVSPDPTLYFRLSNGKEIQRCFVDRNQYTEFEYLLEDKIKDSIKEYDNRINFVSLYNNFTIGIHFNFKGVYELEQLKDEINDLAKKILDITNKDLNTIKIPNEYLLLYKEDFYVLYSGDNKSYDLISCNIEYLEEDTLEDLEIFD